MRVSPLLLAALLSLAACHGTAADNPAARLGDGRYLGIGVYPAGQLWQHLAIRRTAAGVPAATIADDEHVIVLVDSHTGEVRECGDYSAVCVGLTPWQTSLAMPDGAPVMLTKHAADLAAEAEQAERRRR